MLTAQGHPNFQNPLSVRFEPSLVRVVVGVSVKELSIAQGVAVAPADGVGRLDTAAIQRAAVEHREYVVNHLKLTASKVPLVGKVTRLMSPPFFVDPAQTFYQYEIEYHLNGPPVAEIEFYHDMLKEWPYAIGTSWNVSYLIRLLDEDAANPMSWLLRNQQPCTIPTGWKLSDPPKPIVVESNPSRNFREYLWNGISHILRGYDHLLFVAALVIGSIRFWEMVKVIGAFTLAHTLTLALSVFGIFRLPASIVEPIIALSIVLVAFENVIWPNRAHSKVRLGVAFGFGLIHGLGFAGGLMTVMAGLPPVGIWVALVAFSLGVEVGHQVVVLPLFGLLVMSNGQLSKALHSRVLRFASVLIACCGVYYLFIALR
ncbi:MAG: HupE/UreJ family protein [Akkermansiaceae bacterium]|nr:HupE/UreJ family protein [Akkermansiaceae bacterium]